MNSCSRNIRGRSAASTVVNLIECLQCIKYRFTCFPCKLILILWGRDYFYHHYFTDEEFKARRYLVTCPRSQVTSGASELLAWGIGLKILNFILNCLSIRNFSDTTSLKYKRLQFNIISQYAKVYGFQIFFQRNKILTEDFLACISDVAIQSLHLLLFTWGHTWNHCFHWRFSFLNFLQF